MPANRFLQRNVAPKESETAPATKDSAAPQAAAATVPKPRDEPLPPSRSYMSSTGHVVKGRGNFVCLNLDSILLFFESLLDLFQLLFFQLLFFQLLFFQLYIFRCLFSSIALPVANARVAAPRTTLLAAARLQYAEPAQSL